MTYLLGVFVVASWAFALLAIVEPMLRHVLGVINGERQSLGPYRGRH